MMTTADVLASSTHSSDDSAQLGLVLDLLTADEARDPSPRYYLVGPADDEPVELPREVYDVLLHVVEAMRRGLSVTVSPTSQTLTTQQGADLLGISRPTLIKALDAGELPYTRTGTHRRIALTDVLDYREHRRRAQYAAIDAMAGESDESADIAETLADLREARRVIAARRRAQRAS
jgi:excisionase family DNA binding protein